MAKSETESNVDFIGTEDEWETVAEESGEKMKFETVGDEFIGTYEGLTHIVPKKEGTTEEDEFDQLLFRDGNGKLYALNAGYKLLEAFTGENAPATGSRVKLTYVGNVDTGQPSPMKDFRVQVARNASPKGGSTESNAA